MVKKGGYLSIVIPVWNGENLLAKNLPSVIEAKEDKSNKIREIIIIDDASTDNSVRLLKSEFGDSIRLFRHKINRGFSATVNLGVRMARSEFVCLINQDASLKDGSLKDILRNFKNEKVFAVSLHEKGYGPAKGEFRDGFVEHRGLPEASGVCASFWANGGSGVFRRGVWMRLKGLDEVLFSPFYWEDMDLCYRAQKRGYLVLWEPESWVVHGHESVINTSNFKKRDLDLIKERAQLLFIWKNITSPTLLRKHLKGLAKRIIRHPGYFRVFLAAIKKYKEVKVLRKIEMKETVVSDEAIFARFHEDKA